MLGENVASVAKQTLKPREHLIAVDYDRRGSAYMRNQLVAASRHGDWIAFLDDDDIMWPNHLERLAEEAEAGADIVYSQADGYPVARPFDADELRAGGNMIPATVLMRRDLFREVGGFKPSEVCLNGWEDRQLWADALDAGAKFAFVPEPTWIYRLLPTSKTHVGEALAA